MAFWPPFGLNYEYRVNFKGGCSPVNGWWKGVQPPHRQRNLGFQWPCSRNLVGGWDISLAVKSEIVGVASANMQWDRSVCLSCSQKWESTAFELILRSAWGLSSLSKQVGSSTPCQKKSQVWSRESEWRPKYMQQRPMLEMGNILRNKLSPQTVYNVFEKSHLWVWSLIVWVYWVHNEISVGNTVYNY